MMLAIISLYHVSSTAVRDNRKEFSSGFCKHAINPDQKVGGDELSNEEQKEHSKKEFMINTHIEECTKDTNVRLMMNDPFYYPILRFIRTNTKHKHPKYGRPVAICGPKHIYLRLDNKTRLDQIIIYLKLLQYCLKVAAGFYEPLLQKLKSEIGWKTRSQTREVDEILEVIFQLSVCEKNIFKISSILHVQIISLGANAKMLDLLEIFEQSLQTNLLSIKSLYTKLENILFANCYKKMKSCYTEMHGLTNNKNERLDTADIVVSASNLTSQSGRHVRYKRVEHGIKTVSSHEVALNLDNGSNYTSVNNTRCLAQQDVFAEHTHHVSSSKTNIDNQNTSTEDRVEGRNRKMN